VGALLIVTQLLRCAAVRSLLLFAARLHGRRAGSCTRVRARRSCGGQQTRQLHLDCASAVFVAVEMEQLLMRASGTNSVQGAQQ
jgi:hypothetical protein